MRLIIIYGLILFSSNTFAQDSLRIVPVKAWLLSRLIQDATTLRTCDSLQAAQSHELEATGKLLLQTNEALRLSVNASKGFENEAKELNIALQAEKDLTKEVGKQAKRKGRLQGLGIGVVLVVVALVL